MDPRSGVKNYVRLSVFLERHPDRNGGIFVVWRLLSSYRSLPLEGKVPRRCGWGISGMKEDDESGKGRGTCGESVSPREKDFSLTLEMTIRNRLMSSSH